jgi:actin-like ATPase involved in cell morphogenesis
MAQGIDVGTGFIVSARLENEQFVYKPFRDAFLKLDGSNDFTKKIMAQTNANFITKGSDIYIIGEESLSFASLLNKEVQRPMSAGVVSATETEASNILELILQTVAGQPQKDNEVLYFSVPAPSIDVENDIFFHEFTIANTYSAMGYDAKAINEGLAVVYSELGNDQMTGIGISFGAGMVNLCLSLMGAPVIQFSIGRSGDWIDQMAAKACGITANKARAVKEKGIDLSQSKFSSREETAVAAYYKNLIEYVIKNFKQEFSKNGSTQGFDKPIKIVLSGGTSLPQGFDTLFEQVLAKSDFPLNVESVIRAADPLNAVSKGCLIAALADEG